MKTLSILGATGSVGKAALDVVRAHKGAFRVAALAAGKNLEVLRGQIAEFSPALVSVSREEDAAALRNNFPGVKILSGEEGNIACATHGESDIVLAAVVGAAGLRSTFSAVRVGKRVALANKESMVIAGALMREAARKSGAQIIPVDSEHSAIFQCLNGEDISSVKKILLTASGGPFLRRDPATFDSITPAEALKHPTWEMGAKITIDSATLMNKGLEVIEAHFLFGFSPAQIRVVVHPQSVVHSMVEYADGSLLAHLGKTDMKIPIQYALSYPDRMESSCGPFDIVKASPLEFLEPDTAKFLCLNLAYAALEKGGTAPAALNAANEIAVAAFLDGKIRFTDIPKINERVLSSWSGGEAATVDDVLAADGEARKRAGESAHIPVNT